MPLPPFAPPLPPRGPGGGLRRWAAWTSRASPAAPAAGSGTAGSGPGSPLGTGQIRFGDTSPDDPALKKKPSSRSVYSLSDLADFFTGNRVLGNLALPRGPKKSIEVPGEGSDSSCYGGPASQEIRGRFPEGVFCGAANQTSG